MFICEFIERPYSEVMYFSKSGVWTVNKGLAKRFGTRYEARKVKEENYGLWPNGQHTIRKVPR